MGGSGATWPKSMSMSMSMSRTRSRSRSRPLVKDVWKFFIYLSVCLYVSVLLCVGVWVCECMCVFVSILLAPNLILLLNLFKYPCFFSIISQQHCTFPPLNSPLLLIKLVCIFIWLQLIKWAWPEGCLAIARPFIATDQYVSWLN